MEELIDLGDIADFLSERFPIIKGLYLFGSRAFGTGSPRSDIDILVELDGHISSLISTLNAKKFSLYDKMYRIL